MKQFIHIIFMIIFIYIGFSLFFSFIDGFLYGYEKIMLDIFEGVRYE